MRKNTKSFVTITVDILRNEEFYDFGIISSKVPFSFVEIFIRKSGKEILEFLKNETLNFKLGISIFNDSFKEIVLEINDEDINLKDLNGIPIQFHFLNSHTEDEDINKLISLEENIHNIIHTVFLESEKLG